MDRLRRARRRRMGGRLQGLSRYADLVGDAGDEFADRFGRTLRRHVGGRAQSGVGLPDVPREPIQQAADRLAGRCGRGLRGVLQRRRRAFGIARELADQAHHAFVRAVSRLVGRLFEPRQHRLHRVGGARRRQFRAVVQRLGGVLDGARKPPERRADGVAGLGLGRRRGGGEGAGRALDFAVDLPGE